MLFLALAHRPGLPRRLRSIGTRSIAAADIVLNLADGSVLCISRQPFLDGARTLIAVGYSPDIMLFGRRKGSPNWSLRGRLGDAAKLTVDETKTRFAKWKAFSSSAVAAAVGSTEEAATSAPPERASTGSRDCQTPRRRPSAPSR